MPDGPLWRDRESAILRQTVAIKKFTTNIPAEQRRKDAFGTESPWRPYPNDVRVQKNERASFPVKMPFRALSRSTIFMLVVVSAAS
jgi:hypothetical protein